MRAVEEITAAAVAVALFLSTVLFAVDVFRKGRYVSGPITGLTFSVIAIPIYLVAFSDKLPGHPSGLRSGILILPGAHDSTEGFHSSALTLILLLLTLALRLGIYTRLFVIPAFTMTEAEYHSREQTASRANDLSAPVLAYLGCALAFTAFIAGAYRLALAAGTGLCLLLLIGYFASSFLWNLKRVFALLIVQFRILTLNFWLYASGFVIFIVIILGKLEKWRTRRQPGDELFFEELAQRMRRTERKIRIKITEEQEQLRDLAAEDEGE